MFEQSFTTKSNTKRERTVVFALLLQALGVTGLTLLPLIGVGSIEAGKRFLLLAPSAVNREAPVIEKTPAGPEGRPSIRIAKLGKMPQRPASALRIQPLAPGDAPVLSGSADAAVPTGIGIPSGLIDSNFVAPPPVSKHSAVEMAKAKPWRVSSKLSQTQLVFGPKPVYPRIAIAARIAGPVRLQAIINREGFVENLHVLSGHPMLTGPAMEAVRSWRYRPLLLNGDAVEVITEIDVNFTLTP